MNVGPGKISDPRRTARAWYVEEMSSKLFQGSPALEKKKKKGEKAVSFDRPGDSLKKNRGKKGKKNIVKKKRKKHLDGLLPKSRRGKTEGAELGEGTRSPTANYWSWIEQIRGI